MSRSRQLTVFLGFVSAAAVGLGLNWFFEGLMSDGPPGRLAYKPVDGTPPPVNLAAVQRDWPTGLDETAQLGRLATYVRDTERQAASIPLAVPTSAAPPPAPVDLGSLLASADANVGKVKTQACRSCHDFMQGGPDRIGPNLWGIVGRDIASRPGFAYSPAMSAQQGSWSYDRLFAYLEAPARVIPGNRMGFGGMRNPQDRAEVIAYLSTLGTKPTRP